MQLTLWQSNGRRCCFYVTPSNEVYNPIYLGCQHLSTISRCRKTGKPQTCAVIHDGSTDGELLIGKENDGEEQDDGDAHPGPPEHDDSQNEGDG
jgi:hypothetical protein